MLKSDLKNLMLKVYYELELFDNAFSLIDSYRHFLTNDKTLSPEERKKNKDFVDFVSYLIRFRISDKFSYRTKLQKISEKRLPHLDWVNDKIRELDSDIRIFV